MEINSFLNPKALKNHWKENFKKVRARDGADKNIRYFILDKRKISLFV